MAPEICGWESASFHAPGPLTSVFIPSLPCQTASLCCHGPTRPLTQGLASEFLGNRLGFYVDPGAAGLAGKRSAARGLWFALVGVSYALLVLPIGRKHRRPGPCSSSGTSVFSSAKWEAVTLLRVEEGGSVGMCVKWAASKRRQLTACGSLDFLICVLRTEPQRMSSGTLQTCVLGVGLRDPHHVLVKGPLCLPPVTVTGVLVRLNGKGWHSSSSRRSAGGSGPGVPRAQGLQGALTTCGEAGGLEASSQEQQERAC